MCQDLPVRQAARSLRVRDKQLCRRIEHYVTQARRHQDMAAYLPNDLISYDRFHIVKLTGEAMDAVRTAEWKTEQARVEEELGHLSPKQRRSILWEMQRNPKEWTTEQLEAMHWLILMLTRSR